MILALDLGSTTGYAVVNEEDGSTVYHGTVTDDRFVETFRDLLLEYEPAYVVIEDPIIIRGPLGDSLRRVSAQALSLAPYAEVVRPSDWKPHPISKEHLPRMSVHEKDAVHIARWFWHVHLQGKA